jgi:adenylate cyclase
MAHGTLPNQTFVFADIVGFTAVTEHEGDARALELASTLATAAALIAADTGAQLVKCIGDAVMLCVDDARIGLAVALRLERDLARIPGFPLLHVGVHTGPALHADGDWFGHTVNIAARVTNSAEAGEVLCTESTVAGCQESFGLAFTPHGPREFKNASAPVAVYTVTQTRTRFVRRTAATPTASALLTPDEMEVVA